MAVLRLAKAREATTKKGEDYKVDVRTYMRSLGYGQTTDSNVEAHRQDMVLVPMDDRPSRQEQWVEAKNTDLSVTDNRFAAELRAYLGDWLLRREAAKFRLWVFAKRLKNFDKWHEVFGDNLAEDAVREWLQETEHASDAAESRIAGADFATILSFFSETQVVEADAETLRESVHDRSRTGTSGLGSPQWARDLAAQMEKRARPLPAKTHVFANLVKLQPPTKYVELEIESMSLDDVKAAFAGQPRPPFGFLDKGRLLAIDTENVELDFAPVYASIANRLDLDEVESLYPAQLMQLLNRGLSSIVHRKGVKWGGTCYYFLADEDVAKGKGRVIKALGTRLTVASPKMIEEGKEKGKGKRAKEEAVEYLGDLRMRMPGKKQKRLNYVFHDGFNVRCVKLWDGYFVLVHLHRAFTEDGREPVPGDVAAKLDESFRSPEMNRADTQSRKIEMISAYVFEQRRGGLAPAARTVPAWTQHFLFPGLVRVPIAWQPERVDLHDTILFEHDEDPTGGEDDES